MEDRKAHIRHVVLWLYRQGDSTQQTVEKICAQYGRTAVTIRTVQRWFKRFQRGNFNLEDEDRGGRPSVINEGAIKTLVDDNPRIDISEVAERLGVSPASVYRHLHSLGYVNRLEVWLPHELSERNKEARVVACQELLDRYKQENFLKRLVTGDETWILYDNPPAQMKLVREE